MLSSQSQSSGFPCLPHVATFPSEPALFKALVFHAQKMAIDEDRLLFAQGDVPIGVFLVRSGAVHAVVHSNEGGVVAIFHADPGSVLGLPALASDRPYSLSAHARQGSDIAFLGKDDFYRLVADQPGIQMAILRVLASEVQAARATLADS